MKLTNIKFAIDLLALAFVTVVAFWLRLESGWSEYITETYVFLLLGLPVKATLIWRLGLHRRSWSKSGVRDLYALAQAMGIMLVVLALAAFFVPEVRIPRSIPLIEAGLGLLALGMIRLTTRMYFERSIRRESDLKKRPRRVLIAGAGEAGTMLAREMVRRPDTALIPVGYLDDDQTKHRKQFYGVPVLGSIDEMAAVARSHRVEEVLIAMPSENAEVIRRVLDRANEAELPHRAIPGIYDILNGSVNISQLREVALEDLLGRKPVNLNTEEIAEYVTGKTVLVTGAGGSIGSEIVRQVCRFNPERMILLGRGENSIFHIDGELAREWPGIERTAIITDIRDADALENVFRKFNPEVVFHAAAHKHVPLMEANPDQAVFNNVGGTRNLVNLALEYGVQRFVNVSTDKAVNPTSMMGASKRVAEEVVACAARQAAPGQQFVSVRFGNVLGSRGSVIPFFKEQIKRGGPVTVTHAEMTRYFMTIPEASQLVLQAGGLGENGSVFVLDMGEPVRIIDLAHDLIRLSGLEPGRDIEIKVTGMRPGEKLFEEILTAEEGTVASRHEKIYRARRKPVDAVLFEAQLDRLFDAAERRSYADIRDAFADIIPVHMLQPVGPHSMMNALGEIRANGRPSQALKEIMEKTVTIRPIESSTTFRSASGIR